MSRGLGGPLSLAGLAAVALLLAAGPAAAGPAPSAGPSPSPGPDPGAGDPATEPPQPDPSPSEPEPEGPTKPDPATPAGNPTPADASAEANRSGESRVSASVGGEDGGGQTPTPGTTDGAAGGGSPRAEAQAETLPEPEGECTETPLLRVYVVAVPKGPFPTASGASGEDEAHEAGEAVDDPRDHPALECTLEPDSTMRATAAAGPPASFPADEPVSQAPARDAPAPDEPEAEPSPSDDPPRREGPPSGELGIDATTQARPPGSGLSRGVLTLAVASILVPAAGALYRRLTRDQLLENETRRAILDLVERRPGLTAAEVSEELDVHYRTARHHLEILEEFGEVEAVELGARVRYFENHDRFGDLAKRVVASLSSPTKRSVLMEIARRGAVRSGDVAEAVEVAPSTATHHLQDLEEKGLVAGNREGRSVLYSLEDGVLPALLELAPTPDEDRR